MDEISTRENRQPEKSKAWRVSECFPHRHRHMNAARCKQHQKFYNCDVPWILTLLMMMVEFCRRISQKVTISCVGELFLDSSDDDYDRHSHSGGGNYSSSTLCAVFIR
jgi:hypothetical protein